MGHPYGTIVAGPYTYWIDSIHLKDAQVIFEASRRGPIEAGNALFYDIYDNDGNLVVRCDVTVEWSAADEYETCTFTGRMDMIVTQEVQ